MDRPARGVGGVALADAAVEAGVELVVDPVGEDADEGQPAVLLGVVEAVADEELVGHREAHEVAHHPGLGHLVLRGGARSELGGDGSGRRQIRRPVAAGIWEAGGEAKRSKWELLLPHSAA